MKRLIKRILREHKEFKNKLFNLLNSGQDENIDMVKYLSEGQGYDLKELLIEYFQEYGPPYFNIFNVLEIPEEEHLYIMRKILGNINIERNIIGDFIIDNYGNRIYHETSDGFWEKREYDHNGKIQYHEQQHSDGYWVKRDYKDGIEYIEDSDGRWHKSEYDDRGNQIYYEDSFGKIVDRR